MLSSYVFRTYNQGQTLQPISFSNILIFARWGNTVLTQKHICICELRTSSMTTCMTLGSYTFISLSLNFSSLKLTRVHTRLAGGGAGGWEDETS